MRVAKVENTKPVVDTKDTLTLAEALDAELDPLVDLLVPFGMSKSAARGKVLSSIPAIAEAQNVSVNALKSGASLAHLLKESRRRRELVEGLAKHVCKQRPVDRDGAVKAIKKSLGA
jgi:hypothetical protein